MRSQDKIRIPYRPNSIAEVHVNRLYNNLDVLRENVDDSVSSMAVIKADAYGHGAVGIARRLTDRVEWFAVANVDEAIELRLSGIDNPILVFGTPNRVSALAYEKYDLVATVSAFEHFTILQEGTRYHINFDTGMGRYGFLPEEIQAVREAIDKHDHLKCEGVYSHFATADEPGSDQVAEQLERFREIRSQLPSSLIAHISNTGGAVFYKESEFDMIRYGIGLYGYEPGATAIAGLQPVMDWKSFLTQVKTVRKGMTISYNATWEVPYDGYLAVVPVGYADGVPRNLSHNLDVTMDGTTYPVVGIVTMDSIMLFLGSEQHNVHEEVFLFGKEGFTAKDWADKIGTISYEILARLTPRVKRVYVD